jgi:hypothetical protein
MEMLDCTVIALLSNEDGFAANIPLVAIKQVNFTGFSQDQWRGASRERQIAIRTCLRYNPARWCS